MNDIETLVRRAQNGERQAVETLLELQSQRVFAICCHFLDDRGAAEDAAQEALVRIFGRLGELREPSRLASWCAILTANLCRDRLRRRSRDTVPMEHAEEVAGGVDPAVVASGRDTRAALAAAVRQLPETMRRVFLLRQVEDMPTDEVAAALDIPPGTVKSRLFEARRRLREILTKSSEVPAR